MERYFDAFLYLANCGTHVLKLGLPLALLDPMTAEEYCCGDSAFVRAKAGRVILSFVSDDEGEEDDWAEGESHLSSMISVRAELARGDLGRYTWAGSFARRMASSTTKMLSRLCHPGLVSSVRLWQAWQSFCASIPISSTRRPRRARRSPIWSRSLRRFGHGSRSCPSAEKDDLLARLMASNDGILGRRARPAHEARA